MSATTATDGSLPESFQTEWRMLRACRHNVLLEGPVAETNAVLRLLQPHLRGPIVWDQPRAPLELPSGETGGLILRGVAALSADDQTRLLSWIGGPGSRTHIVSTTERALFARVAQGLFDDTLYYRLNVMLLRVGVKNLAGLAADDAEPLHFDGPITVPAQ